MSEATRKRLTLLGCIFSGGLVFLDATVVNVALPSIGADLGMGLAGQQWVVEGYLLTLASLMLVGGSLGDLYGRKRIYIIGLVAFGITSALAGTATSSELLVAARIAQGAAGALLVPGTLAIIYDVFPVSERGRAIGAWSAWVGIFTALGPPIGGALVVAFSWRAVFFINVPLVAMTILIAVTALQPDHPTGGVRLDWLGAVLSSVGLAGVVFALIEGPSRGWQTPLVLGSLLAGVILLVGFIWREAVAKDPMLPLGLFKQRNFAWGNLVTLLMYGGLSAALFFLGLFIQNVQHYSPFAAGSAMLPISIMMLLFASRFGRWGDRIGPRLPMTIGPIICAVGLGVIALAAARPQYLMTILPGTIIYGLGLAITVPTLTAGVLGAVSDQRQAGIASGVNNAISRLAGLLSIAVVGVWVSIHFAGAVDHRVKPVDRSPAVAQLVSHLKERPLAEAVTTENLTAADGQVLVAQVERASVIAFRAALLLSALLSLAAGLIAAVGMRNPVRTPA